MIEHTVLGSTNPQSYLMIEHTVLGSTNHQSYLMIEHTEGLLSKPSKLHSVFYHEVTLMVC